MKVAPYYESGGPEVLRYEDVPAPTCAPNGVVIGIRAIGIEGGDVGNRARGMLAARPHIVGYNCAGVVREVGAQVTDRKVGDRVSALMFNRSEEHTSELQSLRHLVCRLLLVNKKITPYLSRACT